MLNLASVFTGGLLAGYQYAKSVKKRYTAPIDFEEELLAQYLNEIRTYRGIKQWKKVSIECVLFSSR